MSPPSARIEPGNQLEIKCTLPTSSPPAVRSWMKNNKPLEASLSSSPLSMTEDGSLIIHSTKVTDSGNYSCVATNLAGQRISSPVPVIVRSEKKWSEWTTCSINCVKIRTRNCGSKSPSDCVGKEVDKAPCTGDDCKAAVFNDLDKDDMKSLNAHLIFILLIFVIVACTILAILFARIKKKKPEIPDYIVTDNGKLKIMSIIIILFYLIENEMKLLLF